MAERSNSMIVGTGSYIPSKKIPNAFFMEHCFYDKNGMNFSNTNAEIIEKFKQITNIEERRYVEDDLSCSDIAFLAAENALTSSGIDAETLDYIILAHNFGNVDPVLHRSDLVPSLASRVKHVLKIKNPDCVAYDMIFGCPGWLESVIQAQYYLKSGDAKRILVIGADTLSRIADPADRDSMIYADGAGAVILEAQPGNQAAGILAHASRSDTFLDTNTLLHMGPGYDAHDTSGAQFLKMDGRRLYEYAVRTVPIVITQCLQKANLSLAQINKLLIHQANEKMDAAILKHTFEMHKSPVPDNIMPMTINKLGNSSVATLPTLLDLILKGKLPDHHIQAGDNVLFASVGAGMNINALVYRV